MSELLPCPFCGAAPHRGLSKVKYCQLRGDPYQDTRIWCPHGCASVERAQRFAIAAWNTRTPAAQDEGLVEPLRILAAEFARWLEIGPNEQPHYPGGLRPFGTGEVGELVRIIKGWAEWYRFATRDDDNEYLSGKGWDDAEALADMSIAALAKHRESRA